MFCLYVGLCTTGVPGACGSRKSMSYLLELELEMVVSSQSRGYWEQNLGPLQEQQVTSPLSHLSSPSQSFCLCRFAFSTLVR